MGLIYLLPFTVLKKKTTDLGNISNNLSKFWVPSLSKEYQRVDNEWGPNIMQDGDKPVSHQGVGVHVCRITEPRLCYHNIFTFKVQNNVHTWPSLPSAKELTSRRNKTVPETKPVYVYHSIRFFVLNILCRIVEEWKTNLMSLAILFHLLCAQHVSDINMSIFRSLRLCWWITTSVVLFSVRCVLEYLLRLIFGGVRFAGWSRCFNLQIKHHQISAAAKTPTHNERRTRRRTW